MLAMSPYMHKVAYVEKMVYHGPRPFEKNVIGNPKIYTTTEFGTRKNTMPPG